ncbi:hypothetical protein D3C86_1842340 [compost metagenome]
MGAKRGRFGAREPAVLVGVGLLEFLLPADFAFGHLAHLPLFAGDALVAIGIESLGLRVELVAREVAVLIGVTL